MGDYPLSFWDDRQLPRDYSGPVLIWDIDKTYLSTRFSSLRGLLKIPVEFAIDKVALPGMPEILRGLRRGPGSEVACTPLYFISASPPWMRSVLENKMLRDGVEQDGLLFKDWLGTLLQGRPGRLWDQLGFKITALLTARQLRPQSREYLFGDDSEQDPLAFALYAKILGQEISSKDLDKRLKAGGVPQDDRERIHHLAGQFAPCAKGVGGMFIHLEKNSDPKSLSPLHPKLFPVKGAFQLALSLLQHKLIDEATVLDTVRALNQEKVKPLLPLSDHLLDAKRRKLIRSEKIKFLSSSTLTKKKSI